MKRALDYCRVAYCFYLANQPKQWTSNVIGNLESEPIVFTETMDQSKRGYQPGSNTELRGDGGYQNVSTISLATFQEAKQSK